MTLTNEQKKAYLRNRGNNCPYCESPNLYMDDTEIEDESLFLTVSCEDCTERWLDIYHLIDIQEIDPDNKAIR